MYTPNLRRAGGCAMPAAPGALPDHPKLAADASRSCRSLPGDIVPFLVILLLPVLAAAEIPSTPTGFHLFRLPLGEFQSYVSGIYEGQLMMAEAAGVPPVMCVDDRTTRAELAGIVLNALSYLSEDELLLPARTVVFRILIKTIPCPGFRRKPGR